MNIWVNVHTYNSFGGNPSLGLVGSFFQMNMPHLGDAVKELDIHVYFKSSAGPKKTGAAVDIFVSHNSPRHIHDKEDEVHYGFDALNNYIERAKPKLLVHGHQHIDKETLVNGTRIIGVMGHKVVEV